MKKIFVNGNAWSTTRLNLKDWTPYEISDSRYNDIIGGKLFVDPVKTTPKKLATSTTEHVDDQLILAQQVFAAYEKIKADFNSDDYAGDMTMTDLRHLRDEIAIIQEQYNATKTFPSMEVVAKRYPEITKMLQVLQS